MKKIAYPIISVIIAAVFLLSFSGCSDGNDEIEAVSDENVVSVTLADDSTQAEETDYVPVTYALDDFEASENSADNENGAPENNASATVYITPTGEKYHTGTCRTLQNEKTAITRSEAEAQGYEPCAVCNP